MLLAFFFFFFEETAGPFRKLPAESTEESQKRTDSKRLRWPSQPAETQELIIMEKSQSLGEVWTAFWEHGMQERHDLLLRMCWSDTISTWYDKIFIENIYQPTRIKTQKRLISGRHVLKRTPHGILICCEQISVCMANTVGVMSGSLITKKQTQVRFGNLVTQAFIFFPVNNSSFSPQIIAIISLFAILFI